MFVNDVYLSGPFSYADPDMMKKQYEAHCRAAAWLMDPGLSRVYSPISHIFGILQSGGCGADFLYWEEMAFAQIQASHSIAVLELAGWKDSRSIMVELNHYLSLPRNENYIFSMVPVGNTYSINLWTLPKKQRWIADNRAKVAV